MTTQTRNFAAHDTLDCVERPTLISRIRQAAGAVFREVSRTIHAATDLRNELRRMADEVQGTRPEQAARLRKLANSHWGE